MPSIQPSALREKSTIARKYWQLLRSAVFCSRGRWRLSELMQAAISTACFISFPAKCTWRCRPIEGTHRCWSTQRTWRCDRAWRRRVWYAQGTSVCAGGARATRAANASLALTGAVTSSPLRPIQWPHHQSHAARAQVLRQKRRWFVISSSS